MPVETHKGNTPQDLEFAGEVFVNSGVSLLNVYSNPKVVFILVRLGWIYKEIYT